MARSDGTSTFRRARWTGRPLVIHEKFDGQLTRTVICSPASPRCRRTAESSPRGFAVAGRHVAVGNVAAGVLYERIGVPFLLVGGDLQTGDYLWDDEPDYNGCQVTTVQQRPRWPRHSDSARPAACDRPGPRRRGLEETLRTALEGDSVRALLIDTDGVVSSTVACKRIHQPLWETPKGLTPAQRDLSRVVLLIARLANTTPDLAATKPPTDAVPWFTPALRHLVERILVEPAGGSIAELPDAVRR